MAESEVKALTLTVTEAARLLGVSRTTAYECVRTGQLRAVRLGRRLVVPRDAIVELLAAPPERAAAAFEAGADGDAVHAASRPT